MTVQEFIEHNQGKTLELQDVKVPIRKPKYKCKNKHFQKLLIKMFGYQMEDYICSTNEIHKKGKLKFSLGKKN